MGWIKMRTDLPDDPDVIEIAHATRLDPDTVVGKLHRFWSWADTYLIDSNARGVTLAWLDRYVRVENFGAALIQVGWLEAHEWGLLLPNFERHNLKTAKERALAARRAEKHRGKSNARTVTGGVTKGVTKSAPTETETEYLCNTSSPSTESLGKTRAREPAAVGAGHEVSVGEISEAAGLIFSKTGYHGSDGALLWKLAAMMHVGIVPESTVWRLCQVVREYPARNPIALMRKTLRECLAESGKDLSRVLRSVRLTPNLPTSAPQLAGCAALVPDLSMERNSYGD